MNSDRSAPFKNQADSAKQQPPPIGHAAPPIDTIKSDTLSLQSYAMVSTSQMSDEKYSATFVFEDVIDERLHTEVFDVVWAALLLAPAKSIDWCPAAGDEAAGRGRHAAPSASMGSLVGAAAPIPSLSNCGLPICCRRVTVRGRYHR